MHDSVVLDITGIAAGGAGVGRLDDGRVTFVHRTAPGDRAEVRLREDHGRWTRSDLVAIQAPGPGRREAPCPHYDRCGGCTLEHLGYQAQLQAKHRLVVDALRRIGGITADPGPVTASPREFHYRNRVSFTLLRLAAGPVAGFHELERPGRILDIDGRCMLPEPALAAAWAAIREHWGAGAELLPAGRKLRLTVRATAEGRVSLLVDGGRDTGRAGTILARVDALDAVWHRPHPGAAPVLLAGEPLQEHWLDDEVGLEGGAFLQVNRYAAELMERHVEDRVRAAAPARVVDAYCGVGLYARRLVAAGMEVAGIEADGAAVAEARRAAPGARILEGAVEALLGETLPADLVILNPPRTGLAEEVTATLAATPPARAVYVSCDPATLARDLARLGDRFRLLGLRCFDLFPQTAHVETVVELACATT